MAFCVAQKSGALIAKPSDQVVPSLLLTLMDNGRPLGNEISVTVTEHTIWEVEMKAALEAKAPILHLSDSRS